jgi:hypothetical protein
MYGPIQRLVKITGAPSAKWTRLPIRYYWDLPGSILSFLRGGIFLSHCTLIEWGIVHLTSDEE